MIMRYATMELNIYKQHTETTDGRKTTNDALITLLRAGVIASIMMLVLGAGMAAASISGIGCAKRTA